MEWIVAIGVVLGIIILIGMYTLRVKTRRNVYLRGHFDFAQFKDRELSKRGVYDRTAWWK